ncbi:urease accessory protein UreE, partial [Pseudomonas syringae group genomosp. 7]|uniref:urease accessory protein UreE n=1 Tax=Pseudomonas syringae group genomosp. 7 TaxID=251699 RepID=UPI00376F55C3
RSKSRLGCFSAENEDVGLFLQRGQSPLRDGVFLQAQDGRIVRVCARPENLMHVTCSSTFELTRAAYQLGIRHVALQVWDGWLRLLED